VLGLQGYRIRVTGLGLHGYRVRVTGLQVTGLGLQGEAVRARVTGLGLHVSRVRLQGYMAGLQGFGYRVTGLAFWIRVTG
jgi:hypothetical protein